MLAENQSVEKPEMTAAQTATASQARSRVSARALRKLVDGLVQERQQVLAELGVDEVDLSRCDARFRQPDASCVPRHIEELEDRRLRTVVRG